MDDELQYISDDQLESLRDVARQQYENHVFLTDYWYKTVERWQGELDRRAAG